MTALLAMLINFGVWSIVLTRPGVRSVVGRHRIWAALTVLPLQPFLLGAIAALTSDQAEIEAKWVVLGVLAYVNGLVAFALVTGIQDGMRRNRAPIVPEPVHPR